MAEYELLEDDHGYYVEHDNTKIYVEQAEDGTWNAIEDGVSLFGKDAEPPVESDIPMTQKQGDRIIFLLEEIRDKLFYWGT